MLSFIVIGRNEERNLARTIEGIYRAAEYARINSFEVIYVDSKSTDRSIEVVQRFPEVRIFIISGETNAAIARNAGGIEARGNSLFFIDGDMEISGEFLAGVWDHSTNSLNENFVSGQLIDVIDGKEIRRNFNKVLPGGIFLIKKEVWESVGGMNTKFTAGEDYDLGLRLIEKGIRFKRKPEIITKHYTVPILDPTRVWKAMKSRYTFYPRCVLLRDHLFNSKMYYLLWKNDKLFVLFVLSLLILVIYPPAGAIALLLYFMSVVARVVQQPRRYLPFHQMLAYFILFDVLNFVYFFTFFPRKRKVEYREVREASLTNAS
jgi:glycosyltransferase involved in cell wall biosynthesis